MTPAPRSPSSATRCSGDLHSAALVSDRGSVDWLCFPRFDSPACFAALLGDADNGRWLLAPLDPDAVVEERAYRDDTFTLETVWRTSTGRVRVVETMPVGGRRADLVRRVEGVEGTVRMRQELVIRFGYGRDVPVGPADPGRRRRGRRGLRPARPPARAAARGRVRAPTPRPRRPPRAARRRCSRWPGPDALLLRCDPLPVPVDHRHVGEFDVAAGGRKDLVLTWYPSHRPAAGAGLRHRRHRPHRDRGGGSGRRAASTTAATPGRSGGPCSPCGR